MKVTKDGREVNLDRLCEGIAKNLRDFGYTDCTADHVRDQLAKPHADRNIIGRFATTMLDQNGVTLEATP